MNEAHPRSRYLAAVNGNGSNGNRKTRTNGHGSNGSAVAKHPVDGDARRITSLIISITRQLLAVDDEAAELPLRQLRVCMLLHESARTMSALSRELGVSLSAMTQIADRLERAGFVKRSFEGSDRRVRCLKLTSRGVSLMRDREQTRIQRVSAVVDSMPEKSRKDVLLSLETLLGAARVCEGSQPSGEKKIS